MNLPDAEAEQLRDAIHALSELIWGAQLQSQRRSHTEEPSNNSSLEREAKV